MHKTRLLALVPLALGLAAAAFGDFEGPTPLAWRWAQSSPVPPSGMPLVNGDTIFVAVGQRVYSLDKATGNQRWKYPTIETVDGFFRTSPVFSDGVLAVATDHTIYGIDPKTGHQVWYYKLLDPQASIVGQPVSSGKSIVFRVGEENLMAVNGADGKPTWKTMQHIDERVKADLGAFSDSVFYFTQTNELYSFNVASPDRPKKIVRFSSVSEDAQPVVSSDVLYVNSSSFVAALNAFSGGTRWQTDTGQDLVYGPVASPNGVAVVSRDGILTILDLSGRVKQMRTANNATSTPMKIDLGAGPVAGPTAVGKFFAVPTTNGVLNLIDADSGKVAWRYVIHPMSASESERMQRQARQSSTERPDAAFYTVGAAGPAVLAGDTLLVLAEDGSLLAFDKSLGVDMTGPEVKMRFPQAGAQVNGQELSLVFKISDDDSGVNDSTIKVTINGEPVEQEFTAEGQSIVTISPYAEKNKPLPDGRAEIAVSVTDWMGNVTNERFTVMIDNTLPPSGAPPAAKPNTPGGGGGGGRGRGRGGGG